MLSGGNSRSNLRARGASCPGAVVTARGYSGDAGAERASWVQRVDGFGVPHDLEHPAAVPGARVTDRDVDGAAGRGQRPEPAAQLRAALDVPPARVDLGQPARTVGDPDDAAVSRDAARRGAERRRADAAPVGVEPRERAGV